MSGRRVGLLILVTAVARLALAAAIQLDASVSITGRVVIRGSDEAIRNAIVTLSADGRRTGLTATDGDGRFTFHALSPNRYTITASKPRFSKHSVISGGGDIEIELARAAAIAGSVIDETGDPVVNAAVFLEQQSASNPGRSMPTTVETNDLGEFRFGDLAPGGYILSANADVGIDAAGQLSGSMSGRPLRVYYPNASSKADAQPLVVDNGVETSGLTIVVPTLGLSWPPLEEPRAPPAVRGRVLKPDGQPLVEARVLLFPIDGPGGLFPAVTDANGVFKLWLPDTRDGRFRLTASRPGYLATPFGFQPSRPRGEVIDLRPGETREDIVITMRRQGVISGVIVDEFGDPIEGAGVRALQERFIDGRRQLVPAPLPLRRTDDLGRFRISPLVPGQYVIAATVGQILGAESTADLPGYGLTYFPGTSSASEMQWVDVAWGGEVQASFSLARVHNARVSGHAVDSAGEAVTGGIALLPTVRSGMAGLPELGARIEPTGAFEFPNVPPGDYVLQVRRYASASNEGEFTYQFFRLDEGADVEGVELRTSLGSRIRGLITIDGPAQVAFGSVEVSAVPVDFDRSPRIGGRPARSRAGVDGRFELSGIAGPRRLTVVAAPSGWMLQRVIVNGEDVIDSVLDFGRADQSLANVELVITPRVTRLTGVVSDRGCAAPGATIIAFPEDRERRYWQSRYLKEAQAGDDGTFKIEGLPPAVYYLAAIESPRDWQDPEVLDRLAREAVRVTVTDGQMLTVRLKLTTS